MRKVLLGALLAGLLAACDSAPGTVSNRPLGLGFDPADLDTTVRPQDDLFRHVNGYWLERTEIPADKSNHGAFSVLEDQAENDIRVIVEEAANADYPEGSEARMIGDLYLSFMDSARADQLGIEPLREELGRIERIESKDDVVRYFARARRVGADSPVGLFVDQDEKNTTQYVLYATQSGLGMPDRDYYLTEPFEATRAKYVAYLERLSKLAGLEDGSMAAQAILDLETRFAEGHWTRVQNRDPHATYNKFSIGDASKLTPNLDWKTLLTEGEITDADSIIIRQPSFFEALNRALVEVPVDTWKAYFRLGLVNGNAGLLSQPFVDAQFGFYGTTLSGTEQNRPRWKRAVSAVEGAMGEAVGKLYVERHFKPEAKERMDQLVRNLLAAYRVGIDELEWMSDATKAEAQAKLAKFRPKIGYPDKWKDYSALVVRRDDLVGNVMRSREVEYRRDMDKLGEPIDRDEWFMTPQTVNAYYSSTMNEIAFPAAILQPPFFNVEADDAINYGAIGAVIGHEISHGFDDQGRKSDGDGNLRDWWTEQDAEEYTKRAAGIVEQYNAFSPIEGMYVNGEMTLGENIGDISGLAMAYKAYQLSLQGDEAPVIEGFTGDQRFFIGWAQVWRRKYREDELKQRLITDVHSPSEYRTNGVVVHQPAYYTAFGVEEGDALYRAPEQRVKIW